MTQSFRKTLGGYDPNAGRSAHAADKPTLIPVPSLLRSLLTSCSRFAIWPRPEPRERPRDGAVHGGRTGRGSCAVCC